MTDEQKAAQKAAYQQYADKVRSYQEEGELKKKKPTRRAGKTITAQRREARQKAQEGQQQTDSQQPTPTPQPAPRSATGARVGYIRVSTTDQNTARQLADIQLDKTYIEKLSGKDTNRPELDAMIEYVRIGDTVFVHSLDRLGRNFADLQEIINKLTQKGVSIQFVKEGLSFTPNQSSPIADLTFRIMAAFSQFERELILERQREGIQQAKLAGKYKGRKQKLSPQQIEELKRRVAAGENRTELAKEMGISRALLYRHTSEAQQIEEVQETRPKRLRVVAK